jgi:uncharacterized protein (TIGR00297 family)
MRPDLPIAGVVALLLSVGGWLAGALTGPAAAAALLVGTAILLYAGWPGGAVLATFFVVGSLVGRLTRSRTASDAKGERRDPWQVLANGGCAGLGALLARDNPGLALWIVTGSLAAAAADTFATAIGSLSPTEPRLLLLGRQVAAGTNGGMTPLGTKGAVSGAALVAIVGALAGSVPRLAVFGTMIGVAGMVLDSILGATLQGRFHCAACDLASDWPVHRCGTQTTRTGGLAWLDNDGVNAATTAAGAIAGALAWRYGLA